MNYLIIYALALHLVAQADPTVGALRAGLEQRQERCPPVRFQYTVNAQAKEPSQASDGRHSAFVSTGPGGARDEFSILPSHRPDVAKPWRLWKRHLRSEKGQWTLDRFAAFNGIESRSFSRKEVREGSWHQGVMLPFESTTDYEPNLFDLVLFWDLNGIPAYIDPAHQVSRSLDYGFRVAGTFDFHGRKAYDLRGAWPAGRVTYVVGVVGPPEFFVIRREVLDQVSSRPYLKFEATDISVVGELAYPTGGKYHQFGTADAPDVLYEFKVMDVQKLTEADRANWFPAWPAGTSVSDQVNNKNFAVAHDRQELERARLEELSRTPLAIMSHKKGFFFLANGIGLVALTAVLWRRSRRRRSAARAAGQG